MLHDVLWRSNLDLVQSCLAHPFEIAAAMTPCMRLYAYLGGELVVRTCGPQHPYRRWIEAYSGGEYQGLVERLEALLDRVGAGRSAVRDGYRYALECELDFFTAAFTS